MLLLLLGVVLTAAWVLYRIFNRQAAEYAGKIPGPTGYPLVGNALELRKVRNAEDILELIKAVTDEFYEEGIVRAWIGPLLFVILHAPKYVEALAASPNASRKGPLYGSIFGDILDGLFVTDDVMKWKELRKPLNKLLTKKLITQDQYAVFVKRSLDLVKFIRETKQGKEINAFQAACTFTADTVAETHLGTNINELEIPKFGIVENICRVLNYLIDNGTHNYFRKLLNIKPNIPKDVKTSIRKLDAFYEWILEERGRKVHHKNEDGVEYYADFLLRRKKEKHLSSEQILKELGDVVIAGTDTTGVSIANAIVFIAMHREIQEDAYQEQISIFGTDTEREPTYEELVSMHCLTRIIKETFRVTSTAIIYKLTAGDVELGEYTIPKGTVVGIYVETLHNDPKYWEKPQTFNPDHFLPENETTRPKHAFIPFGIGSRMCPGTQYGMTIMKVLLSYLLRNFKLSTNLKYENIIYKHNLLREITNGYTVNFTERYKNGY